MEKRFLYATSSTIDTLITIHYHIFADVDIQFEEAYYSIEPSEQLPHYHKTCSEIDNGRLAPMCDFTLNYRFCSFNGLYLLILGITLCCSNECIIQVEQLETAKYHENGKCPELDNTIAQPVLIFTVIFFSSRA